MKILKFHDSRTTGSFFQAALNMCFVSFAFGIQSEITVSECEGVLRFEAYSIV